MHNHRQEHFERHESDLLSVTAQSEGKQRIRQGSMSGKELHQFEGSDPERIRRYTYSLPPESEAHNSDGTECDQFSYAQAHRVAASAEPPVNVLPEMFPE